jgi:hypothetical protein
MQPGKGVLCALATERERGLKLPRVLFFLSGFAGGPSRRGFRYNLFTAADEKIPLSVVHVNNKPQYLVFSSLLHQQA